MAMKLNKVVPFGRSLDEYVHMFSLGPDDLEKNIIGVGDGPAGFNAELTQKGGRVTSVDPLYDFSTGAIRTQFYRVVDNIIDQVRGSPDDWVWTYHASPDQLRDNRINVLETFTADFVKGKVGGRYVTGGLPVLPFEDDQFDLALCSHLLFLYSDHFDIDFHYRSLLEMLRVAREVRIFPLLTLTGRPSPYLGVVTDLLTAKGFTTDIRNSDYELQRGGNEMLVVRRTGNGDKD
jgi:SAM-dependent methyltransferase